MKLKRILAVVLSTTMALSTASFALPAVAQETIVGGTFSSSFEEGDAEALENSVEYTADGEAMTANVDRKGADNRLVGTKQAASVTAPEAYNAYEIANNLLDDNAGSKYLTTSSRPFNIDFTMEEPTVVRIYSITSANDAQERDPKTWTLYGSVDGSEWVELDRQENQDFEERYQRNVYEIENETAYTYYRVKVESNVSGNMTQIGDITFGTNDPADDENIIGMGAAVLGGPGSTWNCDSGRGWTGTQTYSVSGIHRGTGRAYSVNKVYDNLSIPVSENTQLSYMVFPQFDTDFDYEYTSTYVAVDLKFNDGTYLSDYDVYDQYGNKVDAQSQGDSEFLHMREWNHVYSSIGSNPALVGKTITEILVTYDKAENALTTEDEEGNEIPADASFEALFDDISIKDVEPVEYESKADYVSILRGTQSSGSFSRGLNGALVTVPHSFNFWAPTTNSGQASMYTYQPGKTFKHISVSHVASHWIGDRGNYTFMVNTSVDASSSSSVGVNQRATAFSHDNEVAKAHYYKVSFDEGAAAGATMELAPTSHASMMRFTFEDDVENRNVILDSVRSSTDLEFSEDGKTFTAAVKENSNGMGTMYVYGEFSQAPELFKITDEGQGQGVLSFADGTKEVTLKVATSFISADQAKHNVELEIGDSSFDQVKDAAEAEWNEKLDIIDVEGATYEQLVTLYSNMYRLFAYPNLLSENVGSNEEPEWQYRSPYNDRGVVDGIFYYNNGFWDTYRTTWAAYALFTPSENTDLLNGLVQHYYDEGWVPRWIAPSGVNSMVGTSSDVIFGDALLRGQEFDYEAAYESALRNGSAVSSKSVNGRQNINQSIFYGYTGANNGEGMSWGLEGFINDAGIANMAEAMMEMVEDKDSEEYQKLYDEYVYFQNRALNYVNYFKYNDNGDGDGWFKGKNYNGSWQTTDDSFDPKSWGGQYTETNAWNMAFTVVQDGQGLANLYGGREELAAKLDAFFNEDTDYIPGGYGGEIHEMREARQVRMGQYGHSNQPSHHIPYMYLYAGQPYKTQALVREIMDRLYTGSTIGQGYCGDEDNGEMSAWYILSCLGLYPVNMGSGEFAIGSPLFTKATVHLENGKDLVINAENNSRENVYVQSLQVEGEDYNKTYFNHTDLVNGDTNGDGEITLDFVMGSEPSDWGTAEDSVPTSITTGDDVAEPMKDMTSENAAVVESADEQTGVLASIYVEGLDEDANAANLINNNSSNATAFAGTEGTIIYYFGEGSGRYIDMYTITSKATDAAPTSWTVSGSNDGNEWTEIDSRSNQTFQWENYTRPFTVDADKSAKYTYIKIELTGAEPMNIAEIELMGVESKSIDKESLQSLIDQVNAMDGSGYAEVTFQALLEATEAAQAVVDNAESTQDDYVDAYQSVQTAISNLKEIRDAYARIEAESFDNASTGVKAETTSNTNIGTVGNVGGTAPGAYMVFKYVDFGDLGATQASVTYAGVNADCPNAYMEIHLDSLDGELIGTLQTPPTGRGWTNYQTVTTDLTRTVTGQHDIYIYLGGTGKHVANIDCYQFTEAEDPNAPTDESIAALDAALEAAAALNAEDYTEESFAAVTAAVENANAVKANADATNDMYIAATEQINTAIENLVAAPTGDIISASLDRDPATYGVNEEIVMTVVTKDTVTDVSMKNEIDRWISRTWVKSVNNGDGTKTWTIKFSVGSAGENRVMSLYSRTAGAAFEDSGVDVTMTIANPEYNGMVLSVENDATVKVNEVFDVTITTTEDVEDIRILNERGNAITLLSKEASDPVDGVKTWNVSLAVGSLGNNRIFSVVTVNPYTDTVVDNGMTMQVSVVK